MSEANTAMIDTTMSIAFTPLTSSGDPSLQMYGLMGISKIDLTSKGYFDRTDSENPKSSMTVNLNIGAISVEAEIKQLNKMMYVKMDKIPPIAAMFLPADYAGKWISFPGEQFLGGTVPGTSEGVLEKLTAEEEVRLRAIVTNARFIKVTRKFAADTINGEATHHFAFALDFKGINRFLEELKAYINEVGKNDSSLSLFDPTTISESIKNLKDFQGELWVGKKDKLPYKLMVSFGVSRTESENPTTTLKIASIMGEWNKPVSIEAPAESVSFLELAEGLSGSFATAQAKGESATIKAALALLRAEAELYWDKRGDFKNVCTSEPVLKARTEIKLANGEKGFVCRDTATAYIIWADLPAGEGMWCVDSIGFSTNLDKIPSGTSCK
jgi:hypothetical protein